jgi:hypothetical protein
MADKTASYSVRVDSNAKETGDQGAAALERLRASIQGSQSNIRQMGDSLKQLRGVTDEVKGAKDKLKAAIEAERASISSASLAILKQGTTYAKLAEETKKAAAESAKLRGDSIKAAGGPVEELGGKFEKLKSALSTSEGRMALFAVATVAAIAAVYKLGAAIVSTTSDLVQWIFQSGLLNRQMALQREAWTGSEKNAIALGHQLDALANKVATPRAELEKLAGATVKALNNSRVSGQGMVDTFNAVALASAAMGDEVGAKLAEMVARAKNTGRVQINPFELQGTGLKIQDIGAALAKSMHVGVTEATAALQRGRVSVNDFAAALRTASEVRFGQLNALQRLGDIAGNFAKRIQALTTGINFGPFLDAVESISMLFDKSTVSGDVLKGLIEDIANTLGPAFQRSAPYIKEAFERIELGALRIEIALYKARNAIQAAFADQKDLLTTADAMKLIDTYVDGIADGAIAMVRALTVGIILIGKGFYGLKDTVESVKSSLGVGWSDIGGAIVRGLVDGITGGKGSVVEAILDLGGSMLEAFESKLGIKSPSKVFEGYGQDTGEGYERGVEKSVSGVQAAADKLAPTAPASSGGGGSGGKATAHVELHLHAESKAGADAMVEPSFLAKITKAVEDALVSAGIPVQVEPAT